MSINIPNKDQWAKMNDHLNSIAVTLGSRVDTYTWVGIRNVVRSGLAPELFPIGTQFIVPHSEYGDLVFDVVAHDYFKSAKDANAPTMTLLCHDVIRTLEFDAREAFYYAENELPAGTYNITLDADYSAWLAGTYQFTLTKALPKGGQLSLIGYTLDNNNRWVCSYASNTATEEIERVTVTSGNAGTNLGSFNRELNHPWKIAFGNSNYKESAIRQYLNSSAEAGSVWTPQTKFDRAPIWESSAAGFMKGLDNDFLSIIGEVVVPCLTYAGDKYTVNDKFYLASLGEVSGSYFVTMDDDTSMFPYYSENDMYTGVLCKYEDGAMSEWWLRSPDWTRINADVCYIDSDGTLNSNAAYMLYGLVPACTIV